MGAVLVRKGYPLRTSTALQIPNLQTNPGKNVPFRTAQDAVVDLLETGSQILLNEFSPPGGLLLAGLLFLPALPEDVETHTEQDHALGDVDRHNGQPGIVEQEIF